MSSFRDIGFELPSYPIYRAFIVPYRRDKELCDVVEIGVQEVELWREMLEKLKAFLSDAVECLTEVGLKLGDHERLELLGDLTSLFLRIPLNREVIPSVAPSPLKAYMLMRLMKLEELFERQELDLVEFTWTFYDKWLKKLLREEHYPKLSKILKSLERTDVSNLLESCWFLIPADTRPVLNTASLLPHLLLTSAIAWSMAVEKGVNERRVLACLRLAALLHDIGKPFKYKDHVRGSVEVAERLLSRLLSKDDIKFIIDCIKDHHNPKTEWGKIISEADKIASAIDRLKKLVDQSCHFKHIKQKLEDAARALKYDDLDKAFEDWDFWRKVHEEYDEGLVKSLSEEFVRRVREITKNFMITFKEAELDASRAEPTGLIVLLVDVGGIQGFIYRSRGLKQVAAASLVIDTLVMAYVVAYLQWAMSSRCWLPYEAFLYTAGGNIELLAPRELVDPLMNEISRLNKRLMLDYGISLRVVDVELYKGRPYSETVEELMAKMSINKVCVVHKSYPAIIPKAMERGVRRVCQFCFTELPTEKLSTPEGEVEVCRICYNLHNIGLNIHFKEKYESEISIGKRLYRPEEVFEISWDDGGSPVKASERIMEIIAGHDLEELRELGRKARMRNIAVIKVDGTLIGPFMATCLSIADAYERSARIDVALKKSIEVAVSEVYSGVVRELGELDEARDAAKTAISIKIGVLYAGGDDAVMLAPSWTSLLLALVLGKEFSYNLGRVRGLSIGVAVANPKADVWALIDASSRLMEVAKREARKRVERGEIESMICFDVVEAGDLSSSTIDERYKTLRREKLTIQPLDVDDFEEMLWKILKEISEQECSKGYGEVARLTYLASRNAEIFEKRLRKYFKDDVAREIVKRIEEVQDELKGIRNTIGEILQVAKSMVTEAGDVKQYVEYVFPIAYIYACRQVARVGKRYEFVKSLLPDELSNPSRLSDVDRLVKIIGGGVI